MTGPPAVVDPAAAPRPRQLTVLPLIALIFYDVSGGPFGIEDSVRAGGGALLPILGFLILPVLWSLPEALVTAELASAFPTNAGYVAWVSAAFGPAAAFLVGFSKWASGTLDNALYPVLFLDYLRSGGWVAPPPPVRSLAVLALTAALTYLNYRGLHIVGLSALALTAFSLSPFLALTVLAAPQIRPSRWLAIDARAVDLRGYFNSMFWNLNFWDKASTLAGEVEEPRKTFPKAVFGAVGLVVGAYLIPLLAGTGALPSETAAEWTDGFFSEVGQRIGGPWLRVWIQAAAAMSNMGLFEAEMSSDSFQPSLPAGSPSVPKAMFGAFVKLRSKNLDLARPYRIPVGTVGAAVMCAPPVVLITTVMCLASASTVLINAVVGKLFILVHPSDVLGPSIPGPTVLLVDCPTQYHMPELFSLQPLSCFYEDSPEQSGKKANCIIHLGPSSVTRFVDYQNWMKKFGATQHIMAGHEIKNMEIPILKGSARISSRLNFICPQLFPSSGFWSVQPPNDVMENDKNASLEACGSVSAQNLLKFHLRPYAQLGLDRASIPNLFTYKDILQELVSEIPEVSEVPEQVRKFWQNNVDDKNTLQPTGNRMVEPWINQKSDKLDDGTPFQEIVWRKHPRDNQETPCCVVDATREDMEITFLGTGSSQPSKYRNVSSIYINLFARGGILLDCGEGTLGQLKRRFGVNGADEAVKGLRCIWISHIHADHHTGLARILAQRSKLLRGMPHKPLLVIGPRPLERFLNAYSTLEDLDMQFLDCRHTLKSSVEAFLSENDTESAIPQLENTMFAPGSRMENYNRKPASPRDTTALANFKEVLQESGLEILYSVPVLHCPQAFGVVFRAMEKTNSAGKVIPGWKVVYSGDTRPCPALIDASRDATVLIHEATFEDSMKDEAIARNHSTTKEAIEVGTSAGAYRIILTHFSQRYPKIPVIDEVDMEKTCIAFDLMSVNLADLPVVPKVLPHLKVLFKDELAVDEADEIQEAAVY